MSSLTLKGKASDNAGVTTPIVSSVVSATSDTSSGIFFFFPNNYIL